MVKKKSELNVGKGFERIYFVIATVWVVIVFLEYLAQFGACKIHKLDNLECIDFNVATHWLTFFIVAGIVVPIFYFLRWIVAGFKK
tara:strand:- start:563 stop:820 length:258 start_codon:yes stop_codon:yes gene_type:complete